MVARMQGWQNRSESWSSTGNSRFGHSAKITDYTLLSLMIEHDKTIALLFPLLENRAMRVSKPIQYSCHSGNLRQVRVFNICSVEYAALAQTGIKAIAMLLHAS